MSSQEYPLRNHGIYRNLPQFDPSVQGLTAIITGANGISGFGTLRALLDSPQRWSKIYTISRSPLPAEMMNLLDANVLEILTFIPCDFLSGTNSILDALKSASVHADYIFYYTYLQPRPEPGRKAWSNEEELVNVNAGMLSNFLEALPRANITPKRFILQTGGKNYGAHLGPVREPCCESDPQPRHLAPNFYYSQEDLLFRYCNAHSVEWNVIRPPWIIGATTAAAMNPIFPFAVYAAVQAKRALPLIFPGTVDNWNSTAHRSTAILTGYLTEWVALENKCANEAFNSQDTSPLTWNRFWEELVIWFGVEKGFDPPNIDAPVTFELQLGENGKTPLGYGPPQITKYHFTMVGWAKDPDNAKAWQEIMTQHGLTHDPFANPEDSFLFGDMALNKDPCLSMNKARRLGWTGVVDTLEGIFEMYEEMGFLKFLPPMKVKEPKPLI